MPRVIPARRFPAVIVPVSARRAVSLHVALITLSLFLSHDNKEWDEAYERETMTAKKDPNISFVNSKAVSLSYYSLFPPVTHEALELKRVQSIAKN